MKTKKLITIVALLLAGLYVSAQSSIDHQAIMLEKANLDAEIGQMTLQRLLAGTFEFDWAPFIIRYSPVQTERSANPSGNAQSPSAHSAYLEYFEANGTVKSPYVYDKKAPRTDVAVGGVAVRR